MPEKLLDATSVASWKQRELLFARFVLNEYEGHSLYDMVYGNKTDIDMVTGDNHSLNQLNFVALDAIDVEYVPSIKNVRETANDLYSVKSPDSYTGLYVTQK